MDRVPEKIYGWLNSHLSIARFSGGCTLNGRSYVIDYNDPEHPLVLVQPRKRKPKKAAPPVAAGDLFSEGKA
jgi:hypothetical protein